MKDQELNIRNCMLYEFKLGRKPKEASNNIRTVFGPESTNDRKCQYWFNKFESGDFNLNKHARAGRPLKIDSTTLEALLAEDPRQSSRALSKKLNVAYKTVQYHLKKLGKVKRSGAWINADVAVDDGEMKKDEMSTPPLNGLNSKKLNESFTVNPNNGDIHKSNVGDINLEQALTSISMNMTNNNLNMDLNINNTSSQNTVSNLAMEHALNNMHGHNNNPSIPMSHSYNGLTTPGTENNINMEHAYNSITNHGAENINQIMHPFNNLSGHNIQGNEMSQVFNSMSGHSNENNQQLEGVFKNGNNETNGANFNIEQAFTLPNQSNETNLSMEQAFNNITNSTSNEVNHEGNFNKMNHQDSNVNGDMNNELSHLNNQGLPQINIADVFHTLPMTMMNNSIENSTNGAIGLQENSESGNKVNKGNEVNNGVEENIALDQGNVNATMEANNNAENESHSIQ